MLHVGVSFSQQQPSVGLAPFGSFGGGSFDVVNLGNLNVHFAVPINHKAGRGVPFIYGDLIYESTIWQPVTTGGVLSWQPITSINSGSSAVGSYWGWQGLQNAGGPYVAYSMRTTTGLCGQQHNIHYTQYIYTKFFYSDEKGISHPFQASGSYTDSDNCDGFGPVPGPHPAGTQTTIASDGSGLSININYDLNFVSAYLTTRSGATITPPNYSNPLPGTLIAQDSNGNQITVSNGAYTDTLGQTALTELGTAPSNTTLSYQAPSGGTATYTVSYKPYTVRTFFNCNGIQDYTPETNVYLVDKITLPDQSLYQFGYEATPGYGDGVHVTARLASVNVPTGGTITYSYTGGSNGIVCADGTAAGLTRNVSPGGQWTYTRSAGSGNSWTTTITDPAPASNQTVIQFQLDSGNTTSFYESQRQVFQGNSTSGTMLVQTYNCWNGNSSNCATAAVASPISEKDAYVQRQPDGTSSIVKTSYNSSGLPTDTKEYDWGQTLVRDTAITYASFGNNIVDHPSSVAITDASGNLLKKTTYNYDESSVQSTTNTPSHVSISGSRGNVTTVASYSSPTATLMRKYSYYDTGNVYQATDVNGAVTTYTYGACGNSFPTQIAFPISGLSQSNSWDCIGGVSTGGTDVNGQPTTITYNDTGFWRPATSTDPLNNQTSFYYQPNPSYATPTEVATSMSFNSGSSDVSDIQYEDGWGRTYTHQQYVTPGASPLQTVSYAFDANGRPSAVSMPCLVGYAGTCGGAQTT